MRKQLTILSLAALLTTTATAQTSKRIMTVIEKDGTKTEYVVSNVERVTFTEREKPELSNQWALNEDVTTIGSVVVNQSGNYTQLDLYEATEITGDPDLGGGDTPDITFYVPTSLMGQSVDLSTEEGQQVIIMKGYSQVHPTGTFQAKFDRFQKNITLSLEGELNGADDFRAAYQGTFKKAYSASGEISVTTADGTTDSQTIYTTFTVNPTTTGGSTHFAFADEIGAEPADMLTGKYAVWVSVSAAKLYEGDIDMAEEATSYTFRFIDYATGTTYETVSAGTITTAQDYLGRAYVKVSATLENGTQVAVEYVGSYIETESLDALIPVPVLPNGFQYYNADGTVTNDVTIGSVLYKDGTGVKTLYFYPEGSTSKYDNARVEIKFSTSWVGAGKKDLSQLAAGDNFQVKYTQGGITLYSPENAYMNVPNNGTFSVSTDADGNYSVYLDVTNKYNCEGTGVTDGGDNTRLVLSYNGALTGTY